MINTLSAIAYSLFIFALSALSEPKKAYYGNFIASFAMCLVIVCYFPTIPDEYLTSAAVALLLGAITGTFSSHRLKTPALPQMVALLNGSGGLAAGIIGITELTASTHTFELVLLIIYTGFITFSGSLAAFIKLSAVKIPFNPKTTKNLSYILFILSILSIYPIYQNTSYALLIFILLAIAFGFCFILPIGGADMSIIISVLNSISGWSTLFVGFSTENILMIVVGTLVGSSGSILTYMMTRSMRRPLFDVFFKNPSVQEINTDSKRAEIHQASATDAAYLMENANKVIIVPGFGLAAANAQKELADMANILKQKYQVNVKFAIHPVAGRMPGHMNVLLAEADISPDDVYELKDINQEFRTCDVAYVIGANDITNPLAKTLKDSSIYQMPILEVELAKRIIFVKRSLSTGYANIDNPLFYADNTLMLLGDAKEVTKQIVTVLEEE